MKTVIIISIVFIVGFIFFISKTKKRMNENIVFAQQIELSELETTINRLINGELEYNFFGITSDGIDCIYFMNNNGKISIEFEVITNEQKPYVKKIKDFATENNYIISETTYGNKPQYSEVEQAPVYRINLNSDIHKVAEIGKQIMYVVFNKNENTKFDIVP